MNRCGNCMKPHREHAQRMSAPPICPNGGIYREATEQELDEAYAKAFPNGPEPIATFHKDNPDDVARFSAIFSDDALRKTFSPQGGGMAEIHRKLTGDAS